MYEPGTTRLFHEYLREGDKCVIAGAHQGYFAMLAASIIGPTGTVYAFEPEPINFGILKTNTEPFGNVKLFNFCLGEQEQKAPFFYNSDNNGGHALWDVRKHPLNVKSIEHPVVLEVDVKRLDDVLDGEDLSRVKLMLFDVEGAEHSLLKGAINTIVDNRVPYVIVEINESALELCQTSQAALRSFMSLYGYAPYYVDENEIKPVSGGDTHAYADTVNVAFNILFKHLTAK